MPDSTRARSSTSDSKTSSVAAESWMICTISRWSGASAVRASTLTTPVTPFRGVRISWLILARNWLLARLAASAWSRAASRASALALRSVTSSEITSR